MTTPLKAKIPMVRISHYAAQTMRELVASAYAYDDDEHRKRVLEIVGTELGIDVKAEAAAILAEAEAEDTE